MKIISLNIGRPQLIGGFGGTMNSGIGKKPAGTADLYKQGFAGDGVADKKHHGGEDRAVCFYPHEHYRMWAEFCGRELEVPAFGENLTVSGLEEENVYIGDIFRIGETAVQITTGRIPCVTIDRYNKYPGMLKELVKTGKTGYLGRVLEEGRIRADSEIVLAERFQHDFSIADLHHLFFHDRKNLEKIEAVCGLPAMAEAMRDDFRAILEKGRQKRV